MALGDAFVVNASNLNLRDAANPNANVIEILPRDSRVLQFEDPPSTPDWLKVQADGASGYVAVKFLSPAPPIAPSQQPSDPAALRISRDMNILHPGFRAAAQAVLADLGAKGIPLRIYEAFRSPERQQALYAQGRTAPGLIVTKARAWQSYHQYGLAADFVGYVGGAWTWEDTSADKNWWTELHAAGTAHGLEPLDFEQPHLQLSGLKISGLLAGQYPAGGDDAWRENLEAAIARWTGAPPAPPLPSGRPPLTS